MAVFGFYGLADPSGTSLSPDGHGTGRPGPQHVSLSGPSGPPRAACWGPFVATRDGVAVVIQGSPRVRTGGTDSSQSGNPAEAVLEAYLRHGEAFLADVRDRFALAILDQNSSRALLAIDRMGIERLCFRSRRGEVVFSSSATTLAMWNGASSPARPQAVFDYLMLHMVPAPQTAFDGVAKLQAGTCAVIDENGTRISRYWRPEFCTRSGASYDELSSSLHTSLADAVRRCKPDESTGSFLSGGLDSSTVTGFLGQVSGRRPRTFSIGFGVKEYDELEYARVAARRFDASATEYDLGPADIVDAFPRIAAAYDEPFGNSSAVPTYVCARVAASHGVTHLLAGDGGDEIFGGNERYAHQQVFEYFRRLPAGIRRRVIEPAILRISPESGLLPLRKLRSYVEQARIPMPERLEYWNFMYRSDLDRMLEPEFRAAVDPRAPIENMRAVYEAAPSDELLHEMLFYDWQFTLSDNDLRKVNTMCELAGVRVSFPMLDSDVVDVSLRTPANLKMRWARTAIILQEVHVRLSPGGNTREAEARFRIAIRRLAEDPCGSR